MTLSAFTWYSAGLALLASITSGGAVGDFPEGHDTRHGVASVPAADVPGERALDRVCTARELSRHRLIVEGGRELHIEPKVVARSGSRLLVAGKPSYLFSPRAPAAAAELESRDSVFGAVVETDGSARTVPPPPVEGGKVTAVAGIAMGAGAWRVIFAVPDTVNTEAPEKVVAFWHGIYDGRDWSSVERLPRPDGMPLLYFNSSRIAQSGDTVVWASLFAAAGYRQGAVAFERRDGKWTHQTFVATHASDVEVDRSVEHGFSLGITRRGFGVKFSGDSVLLGARGAGLSTDSIFLYTRGVEGWTQKRIFRPGSLGGMSRISLHAQGARGHFISWTAPVRDTAASWLELRGVNVGMAGPDGPAAVIDRSIGQGFTTVLSDEGDILWVTDHLFRESGVQELRLVRRLADSAVVLWRTPQPYTGPFSAAKYSPSDIIVVGPELDRTRGLLVSLLIRVRVECAPDRAQRRD